MSLLTNNSSGSAALDNDFEAEVREVEEEVAPAVSPRPAKKKAVLDLTALRGNKVQPRGEDGKFSQSQYPVRKPGSRVFFRVHPSQEFRIYGVGVMEDEERNVHVVQVGYEPPEDVQRFIISMNLLTCVTNKGGFFLWPYKESTNQWSTSAAAIARKATKEWVRIRANLALGCYESEPAPAELAATNPEWPTLDFSEILNIAFEGRVIDNDQNPVIRNLQGKV